jgi:hypothetical protein
MSYRCDFPFTLLQVAATCAHIAFPVTLQVTRLLLSATSMARSGVDRLVPPCYLDSSEPPLRCTASFWG